VKRHALIRVLVRAGCTLVREGANHSVWLNPASGRISTVPRHRETNDLLVKKILRDLEITEAP